MKTLSILLLVVLVVAVVIAGVILFAPHPSAPPAGNNASSTGNNAGAPTSTQAGAESISDGTITLSYDSNVFGLATTPDQILVKSYIPPCDANFNYCFYYNGTAYQGTNFESAGLRIQKRTDLATQSACLIGQPAGFSGLMPKTASSSDYAASTFANVGDAAAGHTASGALYRLSYKGSCYEFETRIGQSQYANYPSGSIKKFTDSDQTDMAATLKALLDTLTLPGGENVSF